MGLVLKDQVVRKVSPKQEKKRCENNAITTLL
jgi:hypothetical protein